jgi:hypothetical protein
MCGALVTPAGGRDPRGTARTQLRAAPEPVAQATVLWGPGFPQPVRLGPPHGATGARVRAERPHGEAARRWVSASGAGWDRDPPLPAWARRVTTVDAGRLAARPWRPSPCDWPGSVQAETSTTLAFRARVGVRAVARKCAVQTVFLSLALGGGTQHSGRSPKRSGHVRALTHDARSCTNTCSSRFAARALPLAAEAPAEAATTLGDHVTDRPRHVRRAPPARVSTAARTRCASAGTRPSSSSTTSWVLTPATHGGGRRGDRLSPRA